MAYLKLTITDPVKIEIKENAKRLHLTVGEYVEKLLQEKTPSAFYKQKLLCAQCDVYTAINYYQNRYQDFDATYLYRIQEDLRDESGA